MLIANGHRPTPKISPFWVSLNPNCAAQSSIISARMMKPNAVVISDIQHAQKSLRSFAVFMGSLGGLSDANGCCLTASSHWREIGF